MSENTQNPYRVLARKYRPQNFDQLVGQDALVRTLKNAISSGRMAQAYMLTGVRGVGKTTTARLIARAINYTGPDGKSGPTAGPTDDCVVCQAIAEDRHPDVIEMDAASHTGVDDMRDVIDSVRYAPASARYKVYIIDEVHMLSKNAFAALLKTLEEPPAHAKFILATTDIRKVPTTILSRCQRFDLRRFDESELQKHLTDVCVWEKVSADSEALRMIARAGNGSARDGLSLLDQAIALGSGKVEARVVGDMLGLVDQGRVADLLVFALNGETARALTQLGELDRLGADAYVVIEDLLALTHTLIKARVTGSDDVPTELAVFALPSLSRAWQILLRSLQDVAQAPDPFSAAEMAIIRLGYAATLPDPGHLMKTLSDGNAISSAASSAGAPTPSRQPEPVARGTSQTVAVATQALPQGELSSLADVVARLEVEGQMILASHVAHFVCVIKFEAGRIEFVPVDGAPPRLANDLSAALQNMTGERWVVSIGRGDGQPTLNEQNKIAAQQKRDHIAADPAIAAVLLAFPGAVIEES